MESAAYGISRECPNSLKTLAYRQLRKMESVCISASALHLIRACSVSERAVYRIGTPSVCFDRGIIERLAEMSRPYGTTISVDEKGLGFVALESGKSGSEEA